MARMHRLGRLGVAAVALIAAAAPAHAQIDISGEWGSRLHEDLNDRMEGPELGDYTGLPLNEAGRRKAQTWDAAILSSPEEQTKPHSAHYSMRGPGTNLRITKIFDRQGRLIGYTIAGLYGRIDREIWLDGRDRPSSHAEHRWPGFSTGVVDKNKLIVTTTHMKAGFISRNGAPASAKATMTEYFVRHGDMLTLTSFIEDPAYLEEPFVRTSTWVLTPNLGIDNRLRFEATEEIAGRPKELVPAYPLGTRHTEFAKSMGLPLEATEGGAATLYPEFTATMAALKRGERPTIRTVPVPAPHAAARPAAEVEVVEVRPNLHMLVVDGVNVAVHTGEDGVAIVDPGPAAGAEKMLGAVRRLSKGPIRYVINTAGDSARTGANAAAVAAGGPRTDAPSSSPIPGTVQAGAALIAHEAAAALIAQQVPEPAELGFPNVTFGGERKDIYFNGEAIELRSQPSARADGNLTAFFRKSDVIVAGDLIDSNGYPVIDAAQGGTLDGVIRALTYILETTVPERNATGGTLVIPGRGRIMNEADVVEYRNMLIIIRDRIRDMVAKGLTLQQVRDARPLLEYDALYGARTGAWTSDMFLTAAYNENKTGAAQ